MNTKLMSGIMAVLMLLGTTNMSASNKPRNNRMNDQPRQEVRVDNRDRDHINVIQNNDRRDDDRTYKMQHRKVESPKPAPRKQKSNNDATKVATGVVIGTVIGAVISSIAK